MSFPAITHIDQCLAAIEGYPEFVVGERDGYTFIDYLYVKEDTFDCPKRLECRGIKFHPDGSLMARPFQKFFNLGEKVKLSDPWPLGHFQVFEKLDGSMVHGARVNGELRLMTRKGVTGVAERAYSDMERMRGDYRTFISACINANATPIFEYTSPSNQIVVKYEEPQLTLLAVRCNKTGHYASRRSLESWGVIDGIPVVKEWEGPHRPYDLAWAVRDLEGEEGVVIRWKNGFTLKIKADEYVRRHRAVSDIASKKKVAQLVLNGDVDDVIPILSKDDADDLQRFSNSMSMELEVLIEKVQHHTRFNKVDFPVDKKKFATEIVPNLIATSLFPAEAKAFLFAAWDGKDLYEVVKKFYAQNPDRIKTKWRGQ